VECDGAASAVGAGVGAERHVLAIRLRVGDDHRHRPQPAAKIELIEIHPALDSLGAERPPGLSGEAFHVAKRKHSIDPSRSVTYSSSYGGRGKGERQRCTTATTAGIPR